MSSRELAILGFAIACGPLSKEIKEKLCIYFWKKDALKNLDLDIMLRVVIFLALWISMSIIFYSFSGYITELF